MVLISVITSSFVPCLYHRSLSSRLTKQSPIPAAIFSSHSPRSHLGAIIPPHPKNETDVTLIPKPTDISQNCSACGLTFGSEAAYLSIPSHSSGSRFAQWPAFSDTGTGHTESSLWLVRRAGTAGTPFRHIQVRNEKELSVAPTLCTCTRTLKSQTDGKVLGGTGERSK